MEARETVQLAHGGRSPGCAAIEGVRPPAQCQIPTITYATSTAVRLHT
jgi:hypothetical protein